MAGCIFALSGMIMEISVSTAEQLRLTSAEFELIKQKLGRNPNFTELCSFSAMWSEHCSYKNSIKWLKTLPREGRRMTVSAGEENAGLMDLGDGYSVVFKIVANGFGYWLTTGFQISLARRGSFFVIITGVTYSPSASMHPNRKSSEMPYRFKMVITFLL